MEDQDEDLTVEMHPTIMFCYVLVNFRTKPFALRGKNVLTWRDVNGYCVFLCMQVVEA